MYQCPGNEICDMTDNNFAWITSQKQMYSSTNGATTANSQIYFKDTKYYCRNAGHFTTGLNPGQPCSGDKDCNGRSCNGDSGLCFGRTSGMSCNSHTDCDVKLACIAATTYPYLSTCQSWKTSGSCNDDYDCDPKYFCWYASSTAKSSSTKTCLEKFSQSDSTTFGWADINSNALDGMINGKYCKSGYAVKSATDTAKCVTITSVVTDLGTQASPYKCTATNTANTCKYYYDSTNYASSYCECGLDGSTGYCPMPGSTELTKKAIDKINYCHTLDRDNFFRLQRSCLTGSDQQYLTDWTNAATLSFNVTYWPFIQGTTVSSCMYNVFYLSPTQMTKSLSILNPPMILLYLLTFVAGFYLF